MTSPGMGVPGLPPSGATDTRNIAEQLGGFFGQARIDAAEQLAIITDHEARLSANEEAVRQSILQGEAIRFKASGWWKPPKNLLYAELIGVGAGGGGAAGSWHLVTTGRRGGRGGGGGGETHLDGVTRIYADFLPKTIDGDDWFYNWIHVDIYLAGLGGNGSGAIGTGGGNIVFGSNLPNPIVTFMGGNGALTGDTVNSASGNGGGGMIVGGQGGVGAGIPPENGGNGLSTPGGNSASPYSFSGGGGGGGGGGAWGGGPSAGGNGVSTSGGGVGQPGVSTNDIIAAGGSGGGGARHAGEPGGAGGFPGGGGGGGFGGSVSEGASNGGKGGEACLWVLETKSSDAA